MCVIKLYWKPFLVMLLIIYGSLSQQETPDNLLPFSIPNSDKIIHFLMYLLFTLLLTSSNNKFINNPNVRIVVSLSYPLLLGIIMEILQGTLFINYRSFEILDIIANTTGIVVGYYLFKMLEGRYLSKFL